MKNYQVLKINEHIQNSIKSNLDGFLNNVVPLYGNAFFERIIDYNINFKIISLYQYLHYGISKTLLYYQECISRIYVIPLILKDKNNKRKGLKNEQNNF